MQTCNLYTTTTPIIPEGYLYLKVRQSELKQKVLDLTYHCKMKVNSKNEVVSAYFSDWQQLERIVSMTQSSLLDDEIDQIEGSICDCHQDVYSFDYIPLTQLTLRVMNPELLRVIDDRLFHSLMQPIVYADTESIYGYEFLLRPKSQLYTFIPGELFAFAHHTGLQAKLDSDARIQSIRTGSLMLEKGIKRFINFLSSSISEPEHCLKSTFQAVKDYRVDPEDLVFEVVETERVLNINHLKEIFHEYRKFGMKVALDDIGARFSTLEVLRELQPNYAKVDKHLVRNCHQDTAKLEQIMKIHDEAKIIGTEIIAEGVETAEEWEAIKAYVDFGQGFFFGKPIKTPIKRG